MASLHHLLLLLLLPLFLLMAVSPTHSLTCTSQKLDKTYDTCTDLPVLDAQLHYSYNASNSSLSIAYVAPASNSWIAWAINPTGVGMVGAQALMALKPDSGSIVAKTLNIESYHSIVESKLSFEVWDLSTEESDGTKRLYGSVKVPAGETKLNQVWQVGTAVDGNHPKMHDMTPDNRNSKGTLELANAGAPASGPSAAVFSGPTAAVKTPVDPAAPPPASGAPATMKGGVICVAAVLVGMSLSML